MTSIEQTILRAMRVTGCDKPVVAATHDLPIELCRDLVVRGVIRGFVANQSNDLPPNDAGVAGWWIDRDRGVWTLLPSSSDILYLGTEWDIAARMLLVARRAGVRTIHCYAAAEDRWHRVEVGKLLRSRATAALWGRTLAFTKRIGHSEHDYARAFKQLYDEVGDYFQKANDRIEPHRALLVLGSLGPGGAERQASLTAIGLARDGRWKPTVAASYVEGDDAGFHRAAVEREGVAVRTIPSAAAIADDPAIERILSRTLPYRHLGFQNIARTILSYAHFISTQRPQVVQTWMDYCNVLAGIAADMVGVPALIMSGRSFAPDHFEIFQPFMRPGYLELLRRRAAVFTNNSRAGACDYARWLGLPVERFTVLHNGLQFPEQRYERQAAALRASLGIPTSAAVVGSILRFSEEKQPYLWIETAAKVIARSESTYCVAFGGGAMLPEIRRHVASLGLADRIKLPGITRDAWAALSMMQVFLLTSRLEGLPNVLIEAQAMGVPVVTTGRGGMREAYVDGATGLTACDDADALATQVMRLLDDTELARSMSAQATRHARAEFDLDAMIRSTMRAFEIATSADQRIAL